MISKRNYIVMSLIMLVILFLFLFSTVLSDYYNDYDVNHYADREETLSAKLETDDPEKEPGSDTDSGKTPGASSDSDSEDGFFVRQVVWIGGTSSAMAAKAKEWAGYRGYPFANVSSVSEAQKAYSAKNTAGCLFLVDGAVLEEKPDAAARHLNSFVKNGGTIIFASLPSYTVISESEPLRQLLGIQNVRSEQIGLKEIRLYEGFLLGGETIYSFDDSIEAERIDIEKNIPWYDISAGTKTYMAGMLSGEEMASYQIENEDMPAVIWRNNTGDGCVFAINGSYMNGDMAYGILDSMVYEAQDYELHAVVNAQNLVLASYPNLSDENPEHIAEVYGYSMRQFCMEIMWPSLAAAAQKNDWKITSMVSIAQSDASGAEPVLKDWKEYLKYLNQYSGEAGVTLGRRDSSDLYENMFGDMSYLWQTGIDYLYAGAYVRESDRDALMMQLTSDGKLSVFDDVRTIVMQRDENQSVLSWLTDQITLQSPTCDGFQHTYYYNLSLKSMETALGYSNILADMDRVLWPETQEDEWQNISRKFSSYIDTYWKAFSVFEKTTLSESDRRVRSFLNEKITSERKDDTITIQVENFDKEAWVLLRTHGEAIKEMEGGDWQEAEKNAYLLHLTEDTAVITLLPRHELYYYDDTRVKRSYISCLHENV